MKIDMSKEPESRVIEGINLWEVRSAVLERAQSGARGWMLTLKLKYRDTEITDRAQLEGNGWFYGRPKLIALGLPTDKEVDIDPPALIGTKVWLATKAKDDISKKTGQKIRYTIIDEGQLNQGYEHHEKVPDGATVPVAGMGPGEGDPFA